MTLSQGDVIRDVGLRVSDVSGDVFFSYHVITDISDSLSNVIHARLVLFKRENYGISAK